MSRALSFLSPHRLAWREVPAPRILHPEDAIVRPVASTTCDLDRLIIEGKTPYNGPFDIGHECVAEVIALGEGATGFYPGQLVIVSWHISCGHCHRCRNGLNNTCASHPHGAMHGMSVGGEWGGFFSDLVRVPYARTALLALPPGLDPAHAASMSDNIPFGHELTVPHLQRNPGADVLVMGGVGSVALFAAAYAVAAGAGKVDYVDTDRRRLEIAERLGANPVESAPRRRFGSYPITVDASGSAESLASAIRSTEPEGMCSSVGVQFGDIPFPMQEMYAKGIHFYTGRGKGRPNFEAALDFVTARRVRPELVISEIQPFDMADEVLAAPSMKPVLVRRTSLSDTFLCDSGSETA
ncbi:MAG TPA: alcohol dehydrogenase catalytic domain-containing protein [Noviherbaspirillum sp.]|jgi:alcohol dehydrogenase|uniref:zinc-dependent alcohol dehydrogenase n=1 Tax=Noviherbaspirillum sp. TaxID=1926288 RepID=UPI002F931D8A